MLLQRLATGVKQARYRRGPTRTRTRMRSIYTAYLEGPWHLLFNVRQRMVYMNSAEGFALLVLSLFMAVNYVTAHNLHCVHTGVLRNLHRECTV